MPELVAQSSETTSSVKSIRSSKSTQMQLLSKTLHLDLTSEEKVCKPYWNSSCEEISSKLWLPVKTDLPDLELTSSSSLSSSMVESSWFSKKIWQIPTQSSQPTFSPYCITSHLRCTGDVVIVKCRKIRLKPTSHQKILFKQLFGISRLNYNKAIARIKSRSEDEKVNFYALAKEVLSSLPEWANEVPYQVKRMAVKDAVDAFFTSVKLLKSGHCERFDLSFKSVKNPTQSCYIPKSAITDKGIYSRILGRLVYTEKLPDEPMDSRLVKEGDRYYICIPYRETIFNDESQVDKVVALDPGIRTFLSGYSNETAFKLGEGDFKRIARLCLTKDKLLSERAKADCPKPRRRALTKAISRVQRKIKNLVAELHFKCANFLTTNYDVILLPSFETSKMVARKAGRKIGRKTVRAMLTFSFYEFKQRLKHVALQKHKRVVEVNEAFTSKTASWTGEVVNIGSAKVITSNGLTVDRDLNGARGIYLRALVDRPWLASLEAA